MRVTGFLKKALSFRKGLSLGASLHPVVDHGIHACLTLQMTKDPRWQHALGWHPPTVHKNSDEFLFINGETDGLPKPRMGRVKTPNHGILHVKPKIKDGGRHGGIEVNPL